MGEHRNSDFDSVGGKTCKARSLRGWEVPGRFAVCTKAYTKNTPIKATFCYAKLGQCYKYDQLLSKDARSIGKAAGGHVLMQVCIQSTGSQGTPFPTGRPGQPNMYRPSQSCCSRAGAEVRRIWNSERNQSSLASPRPALHTHSQATRKDRAIPFLWKGTHPLYKYKTLNAQDKVRSSSLKKPPLTYYFSLLFLIQHFISL